MGKVGRLIAMRKDCRLRMFVFLCLFGGCANSVSATLMMNVQELAGGGIRFSWSGSGNLAADITQFARFELGGDFIAANDDGPFTDFAAIPGINLSNFELTYGGSAKFFEDLGWRDVTTGNGDFIQWRTNGGATTGTAWTASGFFETSAYDFSRLNPGNYVFSSGSGVAAFDGATLTIVLEPACLWLLLTSVASTVLCWRRSRMSA